MSSVRRLAGVFLELLLSGLGGVVLGVVATVYHSALFPWGLTATVIAVALFLVALRMVSNTRRFASAGALGVVGVVVLFAGVDPQGSVLILADTAGVSFLAAVTIVSALALAWPKFSARPTGYDEGAGPHERTSPQ